MMLSNALEAWLRALQCAWRPDIPDHAGYVASLGPPVTGRERDVAAALLRDPRAAAELAVDDALYNVADSVRSAVHGFGDRGDEPAALTCYLGCLLAALYLRPGYSLSCAESRLAGRIAGLPGNAHGLRQPAEVVVAGWRMLGWSWLPLVGPEAAASGLIAAAWGARRVADPVLQLAVENALRHWGDAFSGAGARSFAPGLADVLRAQRDARPGVGPSGRSVLRSLRRALVDMGCPPRCCRRRLAELCCGSRGHRQ